MVAPVTGPVSKPTEYQLYPPPFDQFQTYYRESSGYRQKPPYNLSLQRRLRVGYSSCNKLATSPAFSAGSDFLFAFKTEIQNGSKDKAWARFVADCADQASLGTTIAEFKQSAKMMASRGMQLLQFARAVKRMDFPGAAKYLQLSSQEAVYGSANAMRKKYRKTGSLADTWLEVHFGWDPLMKDIHSAAQVLGGHIRPKRASGSASETDFEVYQTSSRYREVRRKFTSRYGADISVENENVALLNQLGLINPAAILWELVPFSFVVDWFANVGSFLSGFSDLAGLNVVNSYSTEYQTLVGSEIYHELGQLTSFSGAHIERVPSLDRPGLHMRPLKLPSVSRAATAISLLVQALPRK